MPFPDRASLVPLSRDRSFLIKTSLIIVMASTVIAFLVSLIPEERVNPGMQGPAEREATPDLVRVIRTPNSIYKYDNEVSCFDIPIGNKPHPIEERAKEAIEEISDEDRRALVHLLWKGLYEGETKESIIAISALPRGTPDRAAFLGDLHVIDSEWSAGLDFYLEEAELHAEADYARRSALAIARLQENKSLVSELLEDDSFRAALHPPKLNDYLAYGGHYGTLALRVFESEAETLTSIYVIPALFTAVIWWLILHAFWQPTRRRIWLSLLAFLLGILSAFLTLFTVYLQESAGGFIWNTEAPALSQFVYFLAGVALREETLKLLCFVPLIFLLRRENRPIEVLITAGMVGLGFAFQENIGYYQSSPDESYTTWIRMLTANPLHYSLTGVAGFYLYEMVRRKGHGMEEFLFAFIAVVFAHGIYHSVISIAELSEWAVLTIIFIAIIAYQYFDRLRPTMDTQSIYRRISPMGVFILGSVILTCFVLVYSAVGSPFRVALGNFAYSVSAMVVLAFAFLSRFRDL